MATSPFFRSMPPKTTGGFQTPLDTSRLAQSANGNGSKDTSQIPLGQQLIKAGLLTQAQLAQALREQQQNQMKLGEVCLEHGWLTPQDIYQHTSSRNLSLGEILVSLGYLQFDQLRVALAQQRRFGRKLGEILVWKQWIRPEELQQVLELQQSLQQLASPNAWEALEAQRKKLPTSESIAQAGSGSVTPVQSAIPPNPAAAQVLPPVSKVSVSSPIPSVGSAPTPQPLPLVKSTSISFEDPFAAVEQPMDNAGYERKIASLELQIQIQQQEWDALSQHMNAQVETFQAQYQQRIELLQEKVRQLQITLEQAQAGYQPETKQLRAFIEQLQRELIAAQTMNEKFQGELQQQQALYEEELEQLRSQLRDQHHRNLLQQQALYEDELEQLRAQTQTMQAEIPILKTAHQLQIQELQTQLDHAHRQQANLSAELRQAQELMSSYRQSMDSLQQTLKPSDPSISQSSLTTNGLPVAPKSHPDPMMGQLAPQQGSASGSLPVLTPWARNLFFQLQEAGLLTDADIERILSHWQQQGGKLTQLLSDLTGLQPTTIKFFGDSGSSARLSGCCRIGEYLRAAALVTEDEIEVALMSRPSGRRLGESLVDLGVIKSATAEYFARTFTQGH